MPKDPADTVALILAAILAVVTVGTTLTLLYVSITNPEQDITRAAEAIARIVGTLIAALVGYMAGRQVSRNGNGRK